MVDYNKVMLVDGVWRKVEKGRVFFLYTGLGTNENGTWYVENGEVNFKARKTYFEGETAYIIEDGKVILTLPKNTTKVMLINNVWRMVINGEVVYNYTGIGENENGTWYLENGEVNFNYIGSYLHSDGRTYKVVNSKIVS